MDEKAAAEVSVVVGKNQARPPKKKLDENFRK